jgi:membrane fusion protein (multidrug efflux system)
MKKLIPFYVKTSAILLLILAVVSCADKKQEAPPPPEITVVEVIQKDVPIYRQFVGQVYGRSDIPIRARVAGFLIGIHFNEGKSVNKGQLLYSIDPAEFQAQVATSESLLAEAKTALAKAESDLNRIKPLAEINAVSQSDLDAAQANYDAAIAFVDARESNLKFSNINLSYCWIKSPLDGIIGKTKARVGEFVGKDPNPVILNTVSTTDEVRVEFFIAEAQYIKLAREYKRMQDLDGLVASQREKEPDLGLILADGSTFKYKGMVDFINREVDSETGAILIQTIFPNPDGLLKPGQYAKVVVKMQDVKGGLLVPQRCVMELQGQFSVYVVNSENKVEARQIDAGATIGDLLLVKEGLQAGDKVVIDAVQKVGSGMEVNPQLIEFESQANIQD